MKIIDNIVEFLSKTVGEWHYPFTHKEFNLDHYFELEKMIRKLDSPFVVGLVKNKGDFGSNSLIKLAQLFSKDKEDRKCIVTHAIAHIGIYNEFKHRAVESISDGVRNCTFLKSIGQKDIVILRRPNYAIMDREFCKHIINYIKEVAKRDEQENIEYDNAHDYSEIPIQDMMDYSKNNIRLDCSETIAQGIFYACRMTQRNNIIRLVKRGGKLTWTPSDILNSPIFETIYDSREGL